MTTLSGRITVHGDEPAKTATVELHNSAGDVVDQVQVDADGSYRYHVSAGDWSVRVWDAEGHRGFKEVRVGEGDDVRCDVDLEEPPAGQRA